MIKIYTHIDMSLLFCLGMFSIMEKYKQNERFLADSYKEIEKGYEEQFIAIDNEQIIGSNNRIKKLVDELDRNNENISLSSLIILITRKIHQYII
jgi:hypothetical protein